MPPPPNPKFFLDPSRWFDIGTGTGTGTGTGQNFRTGTGTGQKIYLAPEPVPVNYFGTGRSLVAILGSSFGGGTLENFRKIFYFKNRIFRV